MEDYRGVSSQRELPRLRVPQAVTCLSFKCSPWEIDNGRYWRVGDVVVGD